MKNVTLITGNAGKIQEFSRLLGIEVYGEKISLPEVQSTDVNEVAAAKAQAAYDVLQKPVFVDDTGLYIDDWKGLPGALIAWFLDTVGTEGIIKMLDGWPNRGARVVTVLGYCDGNGVLLFTGELKGEIPAAPRGDNGFGYDPIFIPEGSTKTFAEMTSDEKDGMSMRAVAAAKLKKYLADES